MQRYIHLQWGCTMPSQQCTHPGSTRHEQLCDAGMQRIHSPSQLPICPSSHLPWGCTTPSQQIHIYEAQGTDSDALLGCSDRGSSALGMGHTQMTCPDGKTENMTGHTWSDIQLREPRATLIPFATRDTLFPFATNDTPFPLATRDTLFTLPCMTHL